MRKLNVRIDIAYNARNCSSWRRRESPGKRRAGLHEIVQSTIQAERSAVDAHLPHARERLDGDRRLFRSL
jgi:hypothetical protein